MPKCIICGFEKGVAKHHIIKRRNCGSDDEENIVYLCPNHHWIADFGNEEEKREILEFIKNISGKCGKEIDEEEKKILDFKIRALEEEYLYGVPFPSIVNGVHNKQFTEEEWKEHKNTFNYETNLKMLLGRGCSEIQSRLLHKRAELLLLIRKLKSELDNIKI